MTSPASMGVLTFRYKPDGDDEEAREYAADHINALVAQRVRQGTAFLITTTLDGMRVLRFCALHPELEFEVVAQVIATMHCIALDVEQELVGGSPHETYCTFEPVPVPMTEPVAIPIAAPVAAPVVQSVAVPNLQWPLCRHQRSMSFICTCFTFK